MGLGDEEMRLQINPTKDVEDAHKSNNYFSGFALASTYFEYEANSILSERFENTIPLKTIERMPLQTKIRLLFGLNIIDRTTLDKIIEIIKIRNKLVHPVNVWEKGRMRDIFLRYRLTKEEKVSLLSFNECYAKLMEGYSKMLTEKSKKQ